MAGNTTVNYYEDESQWGDYAYVTLNDVINNYAMSRDPDDYTSSVPRYRILYQARRGLRELYYDVLREVKAIKLELSPSLMVTLPPDYVNYVRISWVAEDGTLVPMAANERMEISQSYLQDNNYELLFDNDGCVLQDDGNPKRADETDTPQTSSSIILPDLDRNGYNSYQFCNGGFAPNQNMSNHFANGNYKIDKNRGVIVFSSNVFGKEIVLEYISDGLYTGCDGRAEDEIRVNKFAETALLDYIHYELIKNRRNVPYNEKIFSRKEFHNSRRIAKRRISTLRTAELIQAFKGSSRWIK